MWKHLPLSCPRAAETAYILSIKSRQRTEQSLVQVCNMNDVTSMFALMMLADVFQCISVTSEAGGA